MIDVSVIIAAYNVEKYIARAINSALSQTGVNLEVIVIDDVSQDQTVTITEQINDPRLHVIRQPHNGGPSAARNAGIAAAQGEWVAILDGDDAFAPGRLARMIKAARLQNADIIVDNLMNVYEDGRQNIPMFDAAYFSGLNPFTLDKFIAGNQSFFGGGALGYLKPVFSNIFLKKYALAYDPDIRIGEDYLLMANALAHGAICAIDQNTGYLYTVRAGSISHRLTPDDIRRIAALDQKFLAHHILSGAALTAQKSRTWHINDALNWACLVEAIKQKNIAGAIKIAMTCPQTLRHLWRPIGVRLKRVCDKVFKS
jgi:succinoglycan biosynthesis protein ExoO